MSSSGTFPNFSLLPVELQLAIWEHAAQQPFVVSIIQNHWYPFHVTVTTHNHPTQGLETACSLSRQVFNRTHWPVSPDFHITIMVNSNTIFYLGPTDCQRTLERLHDFGPLVRHVAWAMTSEEDLRFAAFQLRNNDIFLTHDRLPSIQSIIVDIDPNWEPDEDAIVNESWWSPIPPQNWTPAGLIDRILQAHTSGRELTNARGYPNEPLRLSVLGPFGAHPPQLHILQTTESYDRRQTRLYSRGLQWNAGHGQSHGRGRGRGRGGRGRGHGGRGRGHGRGG